MAEGTDPERGRSDILPQAPAIFAEEDDFSDGTSETETETLPDTG